VRIERASCDLRTIGVRVETAIDGDTATVAKITDVWTFERDTRSRDPNWQLADTDSED